MFLFLLFIASSLILFFRYSLSSFLKCLLASHLILFRLSPLFHLDPANAAIWLVSFDLIILSILRQTMLMLLQFIITLTNLDYVIASTEFMLKGCKMLTTHKMDKTVALLKKTLQIPHSSYKICIS
jgi:hypothetical protein